MLSMRENILKQTGTLPRSAKKGRSIPQTEQLSNSVMLDRLNRTDFTSASGQERMDLLKSSILSRMPVIVPHPQDQMPLAESEAERLSANVYGSTPDDTKSIMESKLGADFSSVRFHTDTGSAAKADAMGARAYTAGNDIYFGTGGFEASAVAHELVHTVQQGAVEGTGVSVGAPLGGVQMLPDPLKKLKRKIKGQTVEEQEAEEQKNSELDQIRKERKKDDEAEKDNRGAPHGAMANKRDGILGNLKYGGMFVGDKIAAPLRDIADDHHKSLDDLNLNRGAYNQLSGGTKFKHTLMNPLAHMRSGEKTMQGSVKRHMQGSVLNDIEAYGVQRERGTSSYSGSNVVNLKHVESPDAREEKRRQMIREQYLAEKASQRSNAAPSIVPLLAAHRAAGPQPSVPVPAAPRGASPQSAAPQLAAHRAAVPQPAPASPPLSGGSSSSALNHVPRPNMSNPGKGPIDDSRFIDTVDKIAGIAGAGGLAAGKAGKGWGDIQKTAQENLGLKLGGKGFMEGQAPVTGMLGGAASILSGGKATVESGAKSATQFRQGDFAGGVRRGFDAASHVTQTGAKVIGALNTIPGVGIADSVVPGLGIATGALQVGSGAAQGIRGTMTARNTDKMMDELQYREKHGQAISKNEHQVFKSAKQMRGQSTVDQTEGYTRALSGSMNAAGSIATVSGAGAIPGVALSAAAAATDFIGGKLADSAAEDIQHTVGNQEVNLDQDVNERLKNKYSEEKWRKMSSRERDQARSKEQHVMLRYHGQKHGDLEQFTVEESQKRAQNLVQGANGGDALSEKLIRGSGVSKGSGGKYDEKAVGRKLYSRDGEDLEEAENRLEKKNSSEILAKLRTQQEDKAKGKKAYQFWK